MEPLSSPMLTFPCDISIYHLLSTACPMSSKMGVGLEDGESTVNRPKMV